MVGIPKGWEIETEPSPFDLGAAADFGSQWGRVTSTARTPEHNRKVGGVPNSYHLTTRGARALDIARGPGVRHADIEAAYRGAGYDLVESLDEGDHSHFAFGSGPAAPQAEQQTAGIPDGWEIEPPEAVPARPQAPPMAASFAPLPTQAPQLSSAPQLTQADRTRGLSVAPAEPAQAPTPWAQGYQSTVDPEKVKQLQTAFEGGASVEQLLTLANQLGGYQLVGGADAVREAVKYRDSGRKGAGFYADQVAVPKQEEPIITARDWSDLTIPQKAGEVMGDFARAIGHPYANRIGRESETAADWIPFIGGASSIERGKEDFKRGDYGAAALNAGLGGLDFIPAVGPVGRFIGKSGKHVVDATLLRSIAAASDGAVDMERAGSELRGFADDALASGGKVTLHVEGKAIPITKPGLVDDTGQSWGAMPILSPKPGDHARLEIDIPEASGGAIDGSAPSAPRPVDRLDLSAAPQVPGRVIDRIDVGIPNGWEIEPPLGRTRPMDTLATPEEMAAAARGIRPQDIRPIPANRLENLDEFERIGDPRPLLTPPNPTDELAMRSLAGRNRRGPPDLVTWIRSRPWALKDEGGELAQYGITNAPRRGIDFAGGENFLGRLVDNANGRSLDDAAQAAWEAGYFPHHAARPSVSEFLEALSDTHRGNNRAFRPADLDEVARFEAATADRNMIEAAAQEGNPLADDVGQPVGLDDLSANEPPAYAYEDLPRLGERVGNIDTAKLDTPHDITRAMKNLEARLGSFDAARGGRVSHAETKALAAELGMTVDELLKVRRGQAFSHSEATAARTILAKAYDELVVLSKRIADEGASDEEMEAFAKAVLRTGAIHEKVTGAIAEAGRALQSMRIPVSSKAIGGRVHEAVINGVGGRDRLIDVAKDIIELQRIGQGPGEITKFAKDALKPRWSDYAVEYYYNALLSGPSTHIVNTVSNLLTQLTQIPEHLIAAGIGGARAAAVRLAKQQRVADNILLSEVGARAFGMMEGTKEGLLAFGRVMKTGDPTDPLTKIEARRHKAIPGVAGSVIRTPTRLLMAEDEFFKATARRSALAGLAVRKARNEGVRGAEAKARIAELVASPTDDMLQEAFDYARYLTFQSPLGSFGQKLSGATEAVPALKLVIPFIRTPINLFKYSLERTPVAQLALKRVRDDYRAGGERRDLAIAKAWFGTGIGALAVTYAAQGMVTGRGPTDPGRRRMMMADGWQPYSIKIGETYYSYSRLDPFATMLGMAADLAASSDQMTPKERENAYTVLTGNIMGQIESKTWLSGLTDLVQALDDPGRFGESYVSRVIGSFVPTLSAHSAKAFDPVARETIVNDDIAASTVNRIKSRIPGLSDDLPARLDAWGQPITSDEPPIVDMLSPFYMQKAKDDPITAELLQVGVGMGKPRRVITEDGEEITLNDKQFAEYQRLSGIYIRDDIAAAMADPGWRALSPEERKREIKKMMAGARKDARSSILDGMEAGPIPEAGAAVPSGWVVER